MNYKLEIIDYELPTSSFKATPNSSFIIHKSSFLLLIACFMLLSSTSFSQKKGSNPPSYSVGSFDIQYGQKIMNKRFANGALNNWSDFNFGSPLSYVGVSYTGRMRKTRGLKNWKKFSGQISLSQLIPQKMIINDSINAKMTGFNFAFMTYGINLLPNSKHFDILIDGGLSMGRVRLYGNPSIKQKNPYFSPTFSITPRFIWKKTTFHIRCSFDYDITNRNWKKMRVLDPPTVVMDKTQFSGMLIFVGIGRIIGKRR